jgi:hypothetical protein
LDVRSPGCIWLAIRSAGLRDTPTTWQLLIISGHAQLGYVHSPEEASDLLLQFRPDTSLTPGPAYTLAVNPGVYGSACERLNTLYQIHFMAVPSFRDGKDISRLLRTRALWLLGRIGNKRNRLGGLWLWRSAVESPGLCGLAGNLDVAAGQEAD